MKLLSKFNKSSKLCLYFGIGCVTAVLLLGILSFSKCFFYWSLELDQNLGRYRVLVYDNSIHLILSDKTTSREMFRVVIDEEYESGGRSGGAERVFLRKEFDPFAAVTRLYFPKRWCHSVHSYFDVSTKRRINYLETYYCRETGNAVFKFDCHIIEVTHNGRIIVCDNVYVISKPDTIVEISLTKSEVQIKSVR